MSGMQDVRGYRAGQRVRIDCSRPARIGCGGRASVRWSSDLELGTGGGGGDCVAPAVVSSPQQRAALYSLASAYGALLRAQHPEYDWVVEILD
jgi:hypothetical protein